jgi:hypothetical protein
MGKFIIHALNGEDQDCVRLSCGIISDVANALGSKIFDYLTDFVPPIIKILKENDHDRDTKLQALVTMGDMAMNAEGGYSPYLEESLQMILSACKVSLTQVKEVSFSLHLCLKEDNPDLFDYIEDLRLTILETLSSITHGILSS